MVPPLITDMRNSYYVNYALIILLYYKAFAERLTEEEYECYDSTADT